MENDFWRHTRWSVILCLQYLSHWISYQVQLFSQNRPRVSHHNWYCRMGKYKMILGNAGTPSGWIPPTGRIATKKSDKDKGLLLFDIESNTYIISKCLMPLPPFRWIHALLNTLYSRDGGGETKRKKQPFTRRLIIISQLYYRTTIPNLN